MRYLGIDFGIKRVGLALSDPGGKLAFPLRTIVRTTREKLFAELQETIAENQVQTIVLGIPYGLDGESTTSTRQALNFLESLRRRTTRSVFSIDESFSTSEAEDLLQETGKKTSSRDTVDHHAAAVILQRFLDESQSME
jgi:putative Holliday junction resolvase